MGGAAGRAGAGDGPDLAFRGAPRRISDEIAPQRSGEASQQVQRPCSRMGRRQKGLGWPEHRKPGPLVPTRPWNKNWVVLPHRLSFSVSPASFIQGNVGPASPSQAQGGGRPDQGSQPGDHTVRKWWVGGPVGGPRAGGELVRLRLAQFCSIWVREGPFHPGRQPPYQRQDTMSCCSRQWRTLATAVSLLGLQRGFAVPQHVCLGGQRTLAPLWMGSEHVHSEGLTACSQLGTSALELGPCGTCCVVAV